MVRLSSERLIASIDVGTTKICVLLAHHLDGDAVEIIGIGRYPSEGLRKGVVVDVAKTIHSIKMALKEAEVMAGMPINSAVVGVSGGHITSLNSHGVVPIKRGQVTQLDIANALAAAKAIAIAQDQQILHVLPQYFIIDSRDKVQDPLGMHGIRLEVQAHIIIGAIASVQNVVKCVEASGVHVSDIVLEQLASAAAVLTKDERELGVAMLDIGGGTSDLAVYHNGSIRHTMVLPVAGNHFTNDLAVGLRIAIADAERLKKEYGLVCKDFFKLDECIEIDMLQGNQRHTMPIMEFVNILRPRAQEVLSLVHEEILKYNLIPFMPMGLVLTGGGSLLLGMTELGQDIFDMSVRIGIPRTRVGLPDSLQSPLYATGYGLLLYAVQERAHADLAHAQGPMVKRVFDRMKSWVIDFF
jgi:cell division protein FtsA